MRPRLRADGSLAEFPRTIDDVPWPMESDGECVNCGCRVKKEGGCVHGESDQVYCYACWRAGCRQWEQLELAAELEAP